MGVRGTRGIAVVLITLAGMGLAGCAGEVSDVDRAQAKVTAKEDALADAQSAMTAASDEFCQSSETYIEALDRYGDVLRDTAPTVGDVTDAGADLAAPRDDAFDSADAAVEAHQDVVAAQQELAEAQTALAQAQAGPSAAPVEPTTAPSLEPLAPSASVDRVTQADDEFSDAVSAITPSTSLTDASEQFNAAAVALELSWLRLFVDAGCISDETELQAEAQVSAYTSALQQELTTTGYYTGAIDGIYGPQTVTAVQALQEANGLPATGTVDNATAAALQVEVLAKGGAAAQDSLASTAALQQTLKLVGFWDAPVDGVPTPELTDALKAFQTELGVEPTGVVDAATVAAFHTALAALTAPATAPTAEPSPTTS